MREWQRRNAAVDSSHAVLGCKAKQYAAKQRTKHAKKQMSRGAEIALQMSDADTWTGEGGAQWPLQEANAAIQMYADPSRKDAIRIRVTEVAPIDYGRKWTWWPATLGHALVTIDQLASSLMQPKVDSMIFWWVLARSYLRCHKESIEVSCYEEIAAKSHLTRVIGT